MSPVTDVLLGVAFVIGVILVAFTILLVVFGLIRRSLRRRRLVKSGIADIDSMNGRTFEQYLEALFIKLGYNVELTKYFGDYGGDLVIEKKRVRTIVQAKRWSKNVGVDAVQQAVAAKAVYKCTQAMVVTNSGFTKQARTLGSKNKVTMWDRERLIIELERLSVKDAVRRGEAAIEEEQAVGASPPVVGDVALADVVACRTCSKILTAGERQYCERNSKRFAGTMLCFRHQRSQRSVT